MLQGSIAMPLYEYIPGTLTKIVQTIKSSILILNLQHRDILT